MKICCCSLAGTSACDKCQTNDKPNKYEQAFIDLPDHLMKEISDLIGKGESE
jgi:hypothetical protein